MENLLGNFNIYMIPPFLSLVVGIALAATSVVKGKFRTENVLFAAVCIGYNLMSAVFLSHHLFRGRFELIMLIERSVHCVYVFLPSVVFLYLYKAFGFRSRAAVIASFCFSALLSVFVWTDYYFHGFYVYSWGYSAKGGLAFDIFGAYCFFAIIYFIFFFARLIKRTNNQTDSLKLWYILLSFIIISVLTLLNVPAISGIDFYPFGNFMFIPMSIMAFGVLRYRLMDIQSILHMTLIWMVTSSLVLLPNAIVFITILPWMRAQRPLTVFLLLFAWFFANYLYLSRMQPKIDQLFNRRRYGLLREKTHFIQNISYLRTLDDLKAELVTVMAKAIRVRKANLFLRKGDSGLFQNASGTEVDVLPDIIEWFLGANHPVEKSMVQTNPYYSPIRNALLEFMDSVDGVFIAPLVRIQDNNFIGFIALGEKFNLKQISADEVRFINDIRSAAAVSISNSRLFQDLTGLKNTLEVKVADRTAELQAAMEELEAVNEALTLTNRDLENAHRIAALDMNMAVNVQRSMFPKRPPAVKGWDIAFEFLPMSGVSGDLYDFYTESGVLKGIALFDVSGHGIASGLITMIARSVVHRNFLSGADRRLGSILEAINGELIRELDKVDNYLTGILLRIDGDNVEYVNAAHPDLYIRRALSGSVRAVTSGDGAFKGSLLGINAIEQHAKALKFRMDEGDFLLLASDCLFESQNAEGIEYWPEHLERAISVAPRESAAGMLDCILDDFRRFIGEKGVADDLTAIVIKRTGNA